MYEVTITIIIICAILLILVILAQNPKGGGVSSQFGGSGATQIMGVKKTGDFLEKATWGLAIVILSFSLFTNFFVEDTTEGIEEVSPNLEGLDDPAVVPSELNSLSVDEPTAPDSLIK